MLQFCGLLVVCALVAAIICLATKNGQQAVRLRSLKRELDAIAKQQEIAADIGKWDDVSVRERLHEIANEQGRKQRM